MGLDRAPGQESVNGRSIDARVLPVKFNQQGKRERDFGEGVNLLDEIAWSDWPLQGPRTTRWYAKFIRDTNTTPRLRTPQWMRDTGVPDGDRVKHEHALLCDVLETAVTYDQLDISCCVSFELVCRRLQLIEEAYGANAKQPRFDSQNHFMGQGRRATAVAPSLVAHVAEEMKAEAAVAKERRKAREESSLQAKK
jgi:hypothetical protein